MIALMTLYWAGRTWRISSEPCDIQDREGDWLHYQGGLSPFDMTDEISFLSAGEPGSIEVELILPTDVALLISQGHELAGASVEIAEWAPGTKYEARTVRYRGVCGDPAYGPVGAPISILIAPIPMVESQYPLEAHRVTSDTLDFLGDEDEGKFYPTPIGRPGVCWRNGARVEGLGSPVYRVNIGSLTQIDYIGNGDPTPTTGTYYLVANGLFDINAGYVRITDYTTGDTEPMPVYRCRDLLGNTFFACNLVGTIIPSTDGDVYYASWSPGLGYSEGGVRAHDRAGCIEGAGEVLAWALELTGLQVDWARVASARLFLDRYILAGYWDSPGDPWKWIQDNLLPILPVSIRIGSGGLYPVVWRHWATVEDAVMTLEDGRNCSFDPAVVYEGRDEIVNRVTLSYAYDMEDGGIYQLDATWTPGDVVTTGFGFDRPLGPGLKYAVESPSVATRTSGMGNGERSLSMTTDMVCDTATADMIVAWMVAAKAHPRRIVTIQGGSELARLESGSVVNLVSFGLAIWSLVGHVRRVTQKSMTSWEIEAMIFGGGTP